MQLLVGRSKLNNVPTSQTWLFTRYQDIWTSGLSSTIFLKDMKRFSHLNNRQQDKMASKVCTEDATWWIHPDSNRLETLLIFVIFYILHSYITFLHPFFYSLHFKFWYHIFHPKTEDGTWWIHPESNFAIGFSYSERNQLFDMTLVCEDGILASQSLTSDIPPFCDQIVCLNLVSCKAQLCVCDYSIFSLSNSSYNSSSALFSKWYRQYPWVCFASGDIQHKSRTVPT